MENGVVYVTNGAERALGLEETLRAKLAIVCIDNDEYLDDIQNRFGTQVWCLERKLGVLNPVFRNTYRLLKDDKVQKYVSEFKNGAIVFKPTMQIKQMLDKLGIPLLNPHPSLNAKFEHKISQYQLLHKYVEFIPKTIIARLRDVNFSSLRQKLGSPFVLQYDRGHTGSSTLFISSQEQLQQEKNKYPNRQARFVKLIKGDVWTVNACVTSFGILMGGLSRQITGIPICTSLSGATVGNDWWAARELSSKTVSKIMKMVQQVGIVMKKHGFMGMFGIDVVVDEYEEPWFIEVNARQTASVSMHSKLLLKQGLIPMNMFHIAEFLYKDDTEYAKLLLGRPYISNSFVKEYNNIAMQPIKAAQLFMRNRKDIAVKIAKTIEYGIYDRNMYRVRNGYSVSDIRYESEIVVLPQIKGRVVSPNGEVVRIQVLDGITKGNKLVKWVEQVVGHIWLVVKFKA